MLKHQIEQQIKEALKGGETVRLSVLRLLLAGIQNEEIAKQRQATDEDVIMVVRRQVRQSQESIEAFRKGGREDLAQKEEGEIEILSTFLPQQMTEGEIKKVVEEVVSQMPENDKNNFGKIMGAVMTKVKGRTDGNTVSKVVKEVLS